MTWDSGVESLGQQLPGLRAEDLKELEGVIERLVNALRPECVYAFGSQARGTPSEDSDIDLLVVVPGSTLPPHQRDQIAYGAVGAHSRPLDILVMTREEFDERRGAKASLPATVLREGRLLYAV